MAAGPLSSSTFSLRQALLGWSSLGIMLVALLLGYFVYQSQMVQYRRTWANKIETELSVLKVSLQEQLSDGHHIQADQTLARMGVRPYVRELALVKDGKILSSTDRATIGELFKRSAENLGIELDEHFHRSMQGTDLFASIPLRYRNDILRQHENAWLYAHYDTHDDLRAMYAAMFQKMGVVLALLLLFIVGLGRIVRSTVIRPLNSLAVFARQLEHGKYGSPINIRASTEFLQIERAFNSLSQSLEESTRQLRDQAIRDHAFIQAFPDMAFIVSREGIVRSRYGSDNEALPGPAVGESMTQWLSANEAAQQSEALAQVLETGEMAITEFRHDDFYIESRMAPLVIQEGAASPSAQGVLWLIRDISEIKRQQKTIERQANFDALTNLANRQLALVQIEKKMASARRNGQFGAVIFIDLDHFANVNDSLGLPVGDQLLMALGERLVSLCRTEDVIARLGGDEYLVIPGELHPTQEIAASNACELAEKLLAMIRVPFDIDSHQLHLSASMGVAVYPTPQCEPYDLIRQSDTAMYHAKSKGRDAISVYTDSMHDENKEKLTLYSDLRRAIQDGSFTLVFQPQFNDRDEMIGAEVLIRWFHNGKAINPEKFIKAAEETNQILPLGRWILRESCTQMRDWLDRGTLPSSFKKLAINISAVQFMDPWFEETLEEELQASQLSPEHIELELTESVFVGDKRVIREKMKHLSQLGYDFALDDFGTGYSSLSYLQHLPINKLKIDRSFIMDIQDEQTPARIVDSIIQLSRNLNMNVIAEGVETAQQRDYLRAHECCQYQGYFFSKPLDAAALESLSAKLRGG